MEKSMPPEGERQPANGEEQTRVTVRPPERLEQDQEHVCCSCTKRTPNWGFPC